MSMGQYGGRPVDGGGTMERIDKATPRRANDRGHGTERVISMQQQPIAPERFREYAVEQLERALDAVKFDEATSDDAVIGAELALMAIKMWLGETEPVPSLDPTDLLDFLAEPECICPPSLVARGGFKSGCPVHA